MPEAGPSRSAEPEQHPEAQPWVGAEAAVPLAPPNGDAAPSTEAPAPAPPATQPQPTTREKRRKRKALGFLGGVQSLAGTIVIAIFVITFLAQAFQIPSVSMEQTLLVGDYLLVDKVHYARGGVFGHILPYEPIHRGDIIVFRYPVHPEQHFVKRVVGAPGDRVRLVNKQVYVNGAPTNERYALHVSPEFDTYRDDFPQPDLLSPALDVHWWLEMRKLVRGGELVVPADRYFVLGDNRDESLDSRYWGFVPRQNIIGRPLVIYLSLRSVQEAQAEPDDRLSRLGVLGQLLHVPRWRRTLRVVQ
jgi:signal peptidase I